MERLDRLNKYFAEKERKRLDSQRDMASNGLPEMTAEEIRQSCRENEGYETPELNDKLYLHFRGFKQIQNLEPYTSCKAIWLDSNGLEKLENLSTMKELRCLYLGKNLITRIEGLESLAQLTLLDLSYNRLSNIENLSCCPNLQTINLSRNALASADAIEHLGICKSIINVDITHNRLDGEAVMSVFAKMEALTALSINGNPVTQMQGFRKKAITTMTKLSYLDRPIDAVEKIAAEAFMQGGLEAEKIARDNYKEAEKKQRTQQMADFRAWQEDHRKKLVKEGRAFITELTEEEREERRRAAEQAAADEQRMLSLGVGRIATEYWRLEGSGSRPADPLQAAMQSVLQQDKAATAAQQPESPEDRLPLPPKAAESNSVDTSEGIVLLPPAPHAEVGEDRRKLLEPQVAVTDSLPLYWSEEMDLMLGGLVRERSSDFGSISLAMREAAVSETFDVGIERTDVARLTSEECRLRWAQLDANLWSCQDPKATPADTLFKVCITPAVLGKGHGAQPDFASMAAMAAGAMPSYLTPPTVFPSVSDLDDEDAEDSD